MGKTALLVSTAIGLTLACMPAAFALPHRSPAIDFAKLRAARRAPAPHVPGPGDYLRKKGTYVTWSAGTIVRTSGFWREDEPVTIHCRRPCTIVTNNTAQLQSYFSYETAICPVVDGYFTNGSCYFSGALQAGALYANRTTQTNLSVGSGVHLVETYLYAEPDGSLGHYQNEYYVYE